MQWLQFLSERGRTVCKGKWEYSSLVPEKDTVVVKIQIMDQTRDPLFSTLRLHHPDRSLERQITYFLIDRRFLTQI